MKRELLQNLKVGDTPLSKEVIDAIMEENGRDINGAKVAAVKPYADYEDLKQQLDLLKQQTTAEGKTAVQWKQEFDAATREHEKNLRLMGFQHMLDTKIASLGGRNPKAICALLETDTLLQSEDPQQAMETALQKLKQTDGYLFGNPPPYARGTGNRTPHTAPTDLAGALREKFERK